MVDCYNNCCDGCRECGDVGKASLSRYQVKLARYSEQTKSELIAVATPAVGEPSSSEPLFPEPSPTELSSMKEAGEAVQQEEGEVIVAGQQTDE